jgi:transposase
VEQKKHRKYTEEFKKSSAKLAMESEESVTQIARNLGINENTLHGWIGKYYRKKETKAAIGQLNDSTNEIKRLQKENARLRQERDILKKAAAYFASEMQ